MIPNRNNTSPSVFGIVWSHREHPFPYVCSFIRALYHASHINRYTFIVVTEVLTDASWSYYARGSAPKPLLQRIFHLLPKKGIFFEKVLKRLVTNAPFVHLILVRGKKPSKEQIPNSLFGRIYAATNLINENTKQIMGGDCIISHGRRTATPKKRPSDHVAR